MSNINFTVNLQHKDKECNWTEVIYGVRSFEVTHVGDQNSSIATMDKVILRGLSGEPEDVEVLIKEHDDNTAGYYSRMFVSNMNGKTIYVLK